MRPACNKGDYFYYNGIFSALIAPYKPKNTVPELIKCKCWTMLLTFQVICQISYVLIITFFFQLAVFKEELDSASFFVTL